MDSSFMDSTLYSEPVLPTELSPKTVRPVAYRILSKKHGLIIQSDALEAIANFIGTHYGAGWKQNHRTAVCLDTVGNMWKQQSRGMYLTGPTVEEILSEIVQNEKRAKANTSHTEHNDMDSSMVVDEDGDVSMDTSIVSQFNLKYQSNSHHHTELENGVDWMAYFKSVDLNHYSGFEYQRQAKSYIYTGSNSTPNGKLVLPRINNFAEHFLTKFFMLRDRTLRNHWYSQSDEYSSYDKTVAPKSFTFIKNLLGRNDQRFAIFGMLTKNSMGLWQLQDNTDMIQLVMDKCLFPKDSYFVEGNFVIVDGIRSTTNKFHAIYITHPPCEDRTITKKVYGDINIQWPFNKNGVCIESFRNVIKNELNEHPQHKIVFLGGDLFLNDLKVVELLNKTLNKLEEEINIYDTLKSRFENKLAGSQSGAANDDDTFVTSSVPIGLVLTGSFYDKPLTVTQGSSMKTMTNTEIYKQTFDKLALIMEKYPKICKKCKVFIVPGDNDPWMSMAIKDSNSIWPKTRIPSSFTTKLQRIVTNLEFVSNPSRINYLGHEIAVLRDDLGSRFRRNDLSYLSQLTEEEDIQATQQHQQTQLEQNHSQLPDDEEKQPILEIDKLTLDDSPEDFESKKLVKTILDQGDLSPFGSKVRPLQTNYWNAMNLTPLPHFVLLSDKTSPTFIKNYKGCEFANVGPFINITTQHASYVEYYPSSKRAKHLTLY